MINPIYQGQTAILCGTGPGITKEVIQSCNAARASGDVKLFGVNLNYRIFDLDVHLACNSGFWDEFWNDIKTHPCEKWTPREESAEQYSINFIEERWAPGLSTDPSYIHAHHGSGPQSVNLALHYGITRMILVGWDMRYPPGGKRHYFGEYPAPLLHWPQTGPNGEMTGLISEMETIRPDDYGIEIVNCTPGSALKHFPSGDLKDFV